MNIKSTPFTVEQIKSLIKQSSTPFYIYDEEGIRSSIRQLYKSFSWNKGFKEYFPFKANANPDILNIIKQEGCFADCCSVPELIIADALGYSNESIMLTSSNTSPFEFKKASELRAIINLDEPSLFEYLEKVSKLPNILCLRYNPGPINRSGRVTWKHLSDDKFGMRKDQIFATYKKAINKGIKRFGLHIMIMSNDLNSKHFIETVDIGFKLARELKEELGIDLEFIDLGGGLGIPYRPDQRPINIDKLSLEVKNMYKVLIKTSKMKPFNIHLECGRYILGPHGYLITTVRHIKESYKTYAGVDASMSDLMRPGMYGSYHHITVLGKENDPYDKPYDVVGSLCENNDKFAINRLLPNLTPDDILVIHDVGTYGRSKVFDFNGKLRPAEFLLNKDSNFSLIRRKETPEDYFRTLVNWQISKDKLSKLVP